MSRPDVTHHGSRPHLNGMALEPIPNIFKQTRVEAGQETRLERYNDLYFLKFASDAKPWASPC